MNHRASLINSNGLKVTSFNKKGIRLRKRNSIDKAMSSRENLSLWNDSLTSSFLKIATTEIVAFNYDNKIPVIYVEKGIIYKELKSKKIVLGSITKLERKIEENNYKIEHIKL